MSQAGVIGSGGGGGGGSSAIAQFSAYNTANRANFTGDGNAQTVIFNGTTINNGTYNTGTYTFTCATKGNYLFECNIDLSNIVVSGANMSCFFYYNNTTNYYFAESTMNPVISSLNHFMFNGTLLLPMNVSDTLSVILFVSNSTLTKNVGLNGNNPQYVTYFCGTLINAT